jgi:hypothetical protein
LKPQKGQGFKSGIGGLFHGIKELKFGVVCEDVEAIKRGIKKANKRTRLLSSQVYDFKYAAIVVVC